MEERSRDEHDAGGHQGLRQATDTGAGAETEPKAGVRTDIEQY